MADIDHGTLVKWVNDAEDATTDSRALSEKCRDYYDGDQITPEERKALIKRKQAPVVINRIKPKMDGLMGMEKSAKTTCKAFPRTPKHEKSAEASSESIRFVLQDNHFDQTRSAAWDNMLVEGTGGGDIIVKPRKDGYQVIINPIPWDRMIWDQHSRRKDFSDARWLGQVIWMDYDEAVARWPNGKDVLEAMQGESSTYEDKPRWMDNTRRRCKAVELYYKENGDVKYAAFTRGGYLDDPKISPYENEEGETEWPYEFGSLFVTREGGRYGAALQLLDVQDEINKRRSKALHLMSVRQTFGTTGAIPDLNKARQEFAKPDGHIEVAFGEFGKDFGVLPTGDMAQAQFNLLAESKMEIDAVGVNAAMSGRDTAAQSGVALRARQQSGQTEVGPYFDTLKWWTLRVYRKVWNRIRQYWKEEKWIRVTDDEQNLRWVGLNKPVTKGEMMLQQMQQQMSQMPPEQQQQAQAQLAQMQQQIAADPMMKEVVSTENDVADLDVDIILSEVPDVLTAQIEDFQVLGEMVKSGFQIPPMAVIEASPLSNKDKILKMMKEQPAQIPPELQKQMQTMQEQMKGLAEENQKLKQDTQTDQAKLQLRAQEAKAELALKTEIQNGELELERARAEAEINLERAKAEAQLKIEQMKVNSADELGKKRLESENDHKTQKLDFDRKTKLAENPKYEEITMMPQLASSLAEMTKVFANIDTILQKQTQIQEKTLEQQNEILANSKKPKQVSIGNVRKGADGRITGATISTTVN